MKILKIISKLSEILTKISFFCVIMLVIEIIISNVIKTDYESTMLFFLLATIFTGIIGFLLAVPSSIHEHETQKIAQKSLKRGLYTFFILLIIILVFLLIFLSNPGPI